MKKVIRKVIDVTMVITTLMMPMGVLLIFGAVGYMDYCDYTGCESSVLLMVKQVMVGLLMFVPHAIVRKVDDIFYDRYERRR